MAKGFTTPQRAMLAQAIARLQEHDADVTARESAIAQLREQRGKLRDQRDEAEAAIETARTAAVDYLVAQARGNAGPSPETVAQARARHQDLSDQYEAMKEALEALETHAAGQPVGRGVYARDVQSAAAAVLASATPLAGMVAEVEEAASRFLHVSTTLAAIVNAGIAVPGLQRGPAGEIYGRWRRGYDAMKEPRFGEPEVQADPAWADALRALTTDAEAPLPGDASAVVPLKRRG